MEEAKGGEEGGVPRGLASLLASGAGRALYTQVATQMPWADWHRARHTERPGPEGQADEQLANAASQLARHRFGGWEASAIANTAQQQHASNRQKSFFVINPPFRFVNPKWATELIFLPGFLRAIG
jgi:hypothetical protein